MRAGVIIDDGVIARLGPERFYFTTTTGGSGHACFASWSAHALWRMPVGSVNVTGHCAAFNFAGPSIREILQS